MNERAISRSRSTSFGSRAGYPREYRPVNGPTGSYDKPAPAPEFHPGPPTRRNLPPAFPARSPHQTILSTTKHQRLVFTHSVAVSVLFGAWSKLFGSFLPEPVQRWYYRRQFRSSGFSRFVGSGRRMNEKTHSISRSGHLARSPTHDQPLTQLTGPVLDIFDNTNSAQQTVR